MLTDIHINNYAIAGDVHLEFGKGMNVLTGETGAGKSILIGALSFVLGDRGGDEKIRTGAQKAEVEARFDLPDGSPPIKWLADHGLEGDESDNQGAELIIRRSLTRNGRSKAFINGNMVSIGMLKNAAQLLVDIHGQHTAQSLFDRSRHLPLFDSFAGTDSDAKQFMVLYRELSEHERKLEELTSDSHEKERRVDLLQHQIKEITSANIEPGEDESLRKEISILSSAEKLLELSDTVNSALDGGDINVQSLLGSAKSALDKMSALDDSLAGLAESITSALIQVGDSVTEISVYAESVEDNPERLATVMERLELIKNLKKKYGDTIEEILKFRQRAEEELETILFSDEEISALTEKVEKLKNEAALFAVKLDGKRKANIEKFSNAVADELDLLAMKGARVIPHFSYEPDDKSFCVIDNVKVSVGISGAGSMEFLFSPNVGEGAMPLRKIASGGEISRVMLALKSMISRGSEIAVLVFDEVDSGIGGATGDRLGEKLKSLAKRCQVFCVTHLPQVAGLADHHFQVIKKSVEGRTQIEVKALERPDRIEELARMTGGGKAREEALAWAEKVLLR